MIEPSLLVNVCTLVISVGAVLAALYVHWDTVSPDVQVYLVVDFDRGFSQIVVRNFGKSPAYDIEFDDFDFSFIENKLQDKLKGSFLSKGIPLLAPDQQRSTIIATNSYAAKELNNECIEGIISFRKKSFFWKRKLKSSYSLDFYSYTNSLETESEIHKIEKSLRSISNTLSQHPQK